MKITLELDEETFENAAALTVYFESFARDERQYSIEKYILDLMEDDFYQYRREIADILNGHYKNEEYQKILEMYK